MRKVHAAAGATLVLVVGLVLSAVPARAGGRPASTAHPTIPVLTRISTAHAASADVDFVRFHFRPHTPADVTARYVPASALVQDGSGLPLTVRGRSFVQVVFRGAAAHDKHGGVTAPRDLFPVRGTTNILQVRLGGDFEGVVTYFIGLCEPAPGPQVHPTVERTGTSVIVAIPA